MTDPAPGADDQSKSVVGQIVSTLICAPLAFARDAQRHLPGVVHDSLSVGERVVHDYRVWLDRRLAETFPEAEAALRGLGLLPASNGSTASGEVSDVTGTVEPVVDETTVTAGTGARADNGSAPSTLARPTGPPVPVDELAIPDYDSLSASQVVPRLDGLTGSELELVRRYEESARGRRTILSKIAQLQAD